MLSLNAMAWNFSYTYQGKTLYYNITSSNTVEVADCSDNMSGDVVIPSSVTNNGTTYSVTSIGNSAFMCCRSLTSVTIPNSVTSIGNSAFWDCSSLTSVTIPNSVTSIGNSAFWGCSSLTSVTIPNSVTLIGRSTFSGCSSLTSVTIPNSITSIEQDAFWGCSSLTSVTIPNSVTSIGRSTFSGCSSLTSVTIGNSVTSIGNSAFYECSSLTSVTIPNSVTSIGNSAFENCSSLTSVSIGNNVTSIGERAFQECSSLTTLNFNAVNCSDFSSGTFHPFYSCPISTINVSNDVQRIPAGFASGLRALTSVTIPNSVTSIDNEAFAYCYSLTSITIPNSVTSIEYRVFYFCYNLTSITIPNSVTSIGNEAFSGCSNLTSITIPNSVTSIGYYAFEDCRGLTSIISNAILPPVTSSSFPSNNSCNVTVPCGSLEAYTSSEWNNYFPNRITEELSFNLSVAANDDSFGSVSVETQSCNVKTLTATPSICYRFASWNDGNTDNPRTVTLTSDTSFTAIFENVELSSNITAAICEGSTYVENGFNVSQAGVYTQYFQTANGCDSTVTLTLTVNPTYSLTIDATINQGETYQGLGFDVSEAGTYTQNLQSVNGCDSVIVLNLTVNSSLGDVVANTIEIALYPNPAGDYTILKVQGLKEQTKVALFDVRGRKLREFELSAGTETLRLDLRDLPSGVYTLMIGNTTKKLIVE